MILRHGLCWCLQHKHFASRRHLIYLPWQGLSPETPLSRDQLDYILQASIQHGLILHRAFTRPQSPPDSQWLLVPKQCYASVATLEPVSRGRIDLTAPDSRNCTSDLDMSGRTTRPRGEIERVQHSLFSAVEEDNVERVSQLFATTSLQAADATRALDHALTGPAVMRCLLLHGADAKAYDQIEGVRSAELFKLLVEFGYDIRPTGHLIIQYVAE